MLNCEAQAYSEFGWKQEDAVYHQECLKGVNLKLGTHTHPKFSNITLELAVGV